MAYEDFNGFSVTRPRGGTIEFTFACKEPDGSAMDLTGASLWFTAKIAPEDDADPGVFQKSTATSGITVIGSPISGVAEVKVAALDTMGLAEPATLFCDLKVRKADGDVGYPISGQIVITMNVTNEGSS